MKEKEWKVPVQKMLFHEVRARTLIIVNDTLSDIQYISNS